MTATENVSELTDAELMQRVTMQDRVAFSQLYDRLAPIALGLATRMLNNRAHAEEVLQECFWRVWQRAALFDGAQASVTTWFLSIVRNRTIDELRKQKGLPPLVEIDDDGEDHTHPKEIADPNVNVGEAVWQKLRSVQVRQTLLQLPEPQRHVLEMAYFEGLTRQEISERLNEPLGTIHTRARLGLLKLKELLASLKETV